MHFLDEVLSVYRGAEPDTRQYLLTRLSAAPVGFDTSAAVELFTREALAGETPVADQARRELGRVWPAYLRSNLHLEATRAGPWTAAQGPAAMQRLRDRVKLEAESSAVQAPRLEAARRLLGRATDAALQVLASGTGRARLAASLLLGRIAPAHRAGELSLSLARPELSFLDLAALHDLGDPSCVSGLRDAVRKRAAVEPECLFWLAGLPAAELVPVLAELEPTASTRGRVAIAQVAAGLAPTERRPLLEQLAKRRDGWVTAHVLSALATGAVRDDPGLAVAVYRSQASEFIRVLAVKAMGFTRREPSVAFLMDCLVKGEPAIQAAALEALAHQKLPPRELLVHAVPLLSSKMLRAQINACLAICIAEPERVAEAMEALLFSRHAVHRLEAMFILGYVAGDESAATLHRVAVSDSSQTVRVQAIKSLVRQPPLLAADRLLAVVDAGDPATALLAARAIGELGVNGSSEVVTALCGRVATAPPELQAVLLRAVGSLSGILPSRQAVALLSERSSDPRAEVAMGALEGLKHLGDLLPAMDLARSAATAHPGVRVLGHALRYLGGESSAAGELAQLADERDPALLEAVLGALYELAVVTPAALRSERHRKLAMSLGAAAVGVTQAAPPATEWSAPAEPVAPPAGERPGPPPMEELASRLVPKQAAERLRKVYEKQGPAVGPTRAHRMLEGVTDLRPPTSLGHRIGVALSSPGGVAAVSVLLALSVVTAIFAARLLFGPDTASLTANIRADQLVVIAADEASLTGAGGAKEPAEAGTVLSPGQELATGAGSALLRNRAGGNLRVARSSRLTLVGLREDAAAGKRLVFRAPSGELRLDFRQEAVEVVCGQRSVIADRAQIRWQSEDRVALVRVVAGQARMRAGDALGPIAYAGESLELPADCP